MVKVDPDLQRIAGKPAYLAFLSDTRMGDIHLCLDSVCADLGHDI